MAKKVLIVIGERMGKGGHVADGIRKAGGEAHVIPGMAADMKLGDVMHEMNADLGISFCGSGGAGALMASNKYGYKCRHSMRSVDEGVTAVRDGIKVLGFGFMDIEELGKRIVETYYEVNGQPDEA
ncbi:MAG: hypothetical protein HFF16_06825 [Angelakisella sp.]|jgi:uncharacterized protein (TIGR03577 family)|nr:hypothetical protein [Angelakisella sp.]MCI9529394.1 hypothetical protein [Angelakisella sp.]